MMSVMMEEICSQHLNNACMLHVMQIYLFLKHKDTLGEPGSVLGNGLASTCFKEDEHSH